MDQIRVISSVLGTRDLIQYINRYGIQVSEDILPSKMLSVVTKRQPLYEHVSWHNGDLAREDVLDLLDKLLVYDHRERWTADECLQHPFFNTIGGGCGE